MLTQSCSVVSEIETLARYRYCVILSHDYIDYEDGIMTDLQYFFPIFISVEFVKILMQWFLCGYKIYDSYTIDLDEAHPSDDF